MARALLAWLWRLGTGVSSSVEGRGPEDQSQTLVLTVLAGPAAGATLSFVDEFRLGRAEGQGGDLGGDRALSRHHAVFRVSPTGSTTIEDLGSANGTFVNGGRIHQVESVRVGDTVDVGDTSLRVGAEAGEMTDSATELRPRSQGSMARPSNESSRSPEQTGWAPLDPSGSAQSAPLARSAAVRSHGGWVGMVSGVRYRTDQHGRAPKSVQNQVLTFRLEQFTEGGDRSGVLTVELRGPELSGDVADGDRVEVHGRMKKGVLRAGTVHNLTTGATVRQVGVTRRRISRALQGVVVLAFLCLWAAVLYFILRHAH